jgi:LmbE family N-acetylglucosaminyl deacetylase
VKKSVVLIVAHPDDETLWAGGTILSHPLWKCFIVCLSRKNDVERSQKFRMALEVFQSDGIMGDLDDGPEQDPVDEKVIESEILSLLPSMHFDLVITHSPNGEYTRHRRHEETGKAVQTLWNNEKISATELWTFAYEDGNRAYYPIPVKKAHIYRDLTKHIWLRKYSLITEIYGFEEDSWEARTTPKSEAFWQMSQINDAGDGSIILEMNNNDSTIKN